MNKYLKFMMGAAIPLAGVAVVLSVLWLNDIRNDRKHIVLVKSPTPVFERSGGENCLFGGKPLRVVQPGTKLPVRRIRYWKNCATVDVALPDGTEGYVSLGGGAQLEPPPE